MSSVARREAINSPVAVVLQVTKSKYSLNQKYITFLASPNQGRAGGGVEILITNFINKPSLTIL